MENSSPTRNQIIFQLKKVGPQSVEQLARRIDISAMGIRQHLAVLERDGYVSHTEERRHIGRPKYLYRLTERAENAFPKSYDHLADDILSEIENSEGRDKVISLLGKHAQKQWGSRRDAFNQDTLGGRARVLAKLLENDGYLPELKTNGDGFRLELHNCGIIKIAQHYPQTCDRERRAYEELLGATITIERSQSAGDFACSFLIEPRCS